MQIMQNAVYRLADFHGTDTCLLLACIWALRKVCRKRHSAGYIEKLMFRRNFTSHILPAMQYMDAEGFSSSLYT